MANFITISNKVSSFPTTLPDKKSLRTDHSYFHSFKDLCSQTFHSINKRFSDQRSFINPSFDEMISQFDSALKKNPHYSIETAVSELCGVDYDSDNASKLEKWVFDILSIGKLSPAQSGATAKKLKDVQYLGFKNAFNLLLTGYKLAAHKKNDESIEGLRWKNAQNIFKDRLNKIVNLSPSAYQRLDLNNSQSLRLNNDDINHPLREKFGFHSNYKSYYPLAIRVGQLAVAVFLSYGVYKGYSVLTNQNFSPTVVNPLINPVVNSNSPEAVASSNSAENVVSSNSAEIVVTSNSAENVVSSNSDHPDPVVPSDTYYDQSMIVFKTFLDQNNTINIAKLLRKQQNLAISMIPFDGLLKLYPFNASRYASELVKEKYENHFILASADKIKITSIIEQLYKSSQPQSVFNFIYNNIDNNTTDTKSVAKEALEYLINQDKEFVFSTLNSTTQNKEFIFSNLDSLNEQTTYMAFEILFDKQEFQTAFNFLIKKDHLFYGKLIENISSKNLYSLIDHCLLNESQNTSSIRKAILNKVAETKKAEKYTEKVLETSNIALIDKMIFYVSFREVAKRGIKELINTDPKKASNFLTKVVADSNQYATHAVVNNGIDTLLKNKKVEEAIDIVLQYYDNNNKQKFLNNEILNKAISALCEKNIDDISNFTKKLLLKLNPTNSKEIMEKILNSIQSTSSTTSTERKFQFTKSLLEHSFLKTTQSMVDFAIRHLSTINSVKAKDLALEYSENVIKDVAKNYFNMFLDNNDIKEAYLFAIEWNKIANKVGRSPLDSLEVFTKLNEKNSDIAIEFWGEHGKSENVKLASVSHEPIKKTKEPNVNKAELNIESPISLNSPQITKSAQENSQGKYFIGGKDGYETGDSYLIKKQHSLTSQYASTLSEFYVKNGIKTGSELLVFSERHVAKFRDFLLENYKSFFTRSPTTWESLFSKIKDPFTDEKAVNNYLEKAKTLVEILNEGIKKNIRLWTSRNKVLKQQANIGDLRALITNSNKLTDNDIIVLEFLIKEGFIFSPQNPFGFFHEGHKTQWIQC